MPAPASVARPASVRSTSSVFNPSRAHRYATVAPTTPPPTTITSCMGASMPRSEALHQVGIHAGAARCKVAGDHTLATGCTNGSARTWRTRWRSKGSAASPGRFGRGGEPGGIDGGAARAHRRARSAPARLHRDRLASGRSGRRGRPRARSAPAMTWARCTAFPTRRRISTTWPGCRRRRARACSRTTWRPRTAPPCAGCPRPAWCSLGKTHTVQFAFGGVGINHDHGTPHNPWHRVPTRRADRAAARAWRWRPASCRWRSAPTRAGRSGSPPRSAASSGSRPPSGASAARASTR